MRIDVQTHHVRENFVKALESRTDVPRYENVDGTWWAHGGPREKLPMGAAALDISLKLEEMDANGIDLSLLSINIPAADLAAKPADADELARIGNDGIAEVAAKHTGRFRGVASLGFGDIDAACRELDRCVDDLGFVGLQVFAYVGGNRPLDDPALEPVWAHLAERGIPLVLHPGALSISAEAYADYWIGPMVGFLYDESMAAIRLIFSGLLERLPDLKVLLPHGGATLPLLIGRIDGLSGSHPAARKNISHAPSHYFERFYTDTVAHSAPALALAVEQMGAGRVMFASDAPWVPLKKHVDLVEGLNLPAEEAEKIWSGTAKAFFNL